MLMGDLNPRYIVPNASLSISHRRNNIISGSFIARKKPLLDHHVLREGQDSVFIEGESMSSFHVRVYGAK